VRVVTFSILEKLDSKRVQPLVDPKHTSGMARVINPLIAIRVSNAEQKEVKEAEMVVVKSVVLEKAMVLVEAMTSVTVEIVLRMLVVEVTSPEVIPVVTREIKELI